MVIICDYGCILVMELQIILRFIKTFLRWFMAVKMLIFLRIFLVFLGRFFSIWGLLSDRFSFEQCWFWVHFECLHRVKWALWKPRLDLISLFLTSNIFSLTLLTFIRSVFRILSISPLKSPAKKSLNLKLEVEKQATLEEFKKEVKKRLHAATLA